MIRHFSQRDIDRAATGSLVGVDYTKHEEIEYRDGVLYGASGETHYGIPYQQHHRTRAQEDEGRQEYLLNDGRLYSPRVRPRRRALLREQSVYYNPTTQSYFPSVTLNQFSVHSTYRLHLVRCSSASETLSRRRRNIQGSMTYVSSSLKARTETGKCISSDVLFI